MLWNTNAYVVIASYYVKNSPQKLGLNCVFHIRRRMTEIVFELANVLTAGLVFILARITWMVHLHGSILDRITGTNKVLPIGGFR